MVISPSDSSRRRNNKITEKAGSFKKVLCAGTGLGYNKENIQGKEPAMNSVETVNDVLVNLFNEIMDIEERALITPEYKDISVNDMHVIEAVGIRNPRSMSAIAKDLSVTVNNSGDSTSVANFKRQQRYRLMWMDTKKTGGLFLFPFRRREKKPIIITGCSMNEW